MQKAIIVPGRGVFYTITSTIIFGVVAALWHLGLEKTATGWPYITLIAAGFVLLIVVAIAAFNSASAIHDLQAIAPRFSYYSVHGKLGRAVLYEEAQKIVKAAEREILLLNWSAEETSEKHVKESRDKYFSLLEDKSERLIYSRVIQSRSYWSGGESKSIGESYEESYVAHFRAMLDRQKAQRGRDRHKTELLVVPPTIPSTFLIADDNYLVWQLNEVRNPQPGVTHWQIRGAIVIYDPGGEIIREFRATFERAKGEKPRPLTLDDLSRQSPVNDEV